MLSMQTKVHLNGPGWTEERKLETLIKNFSGNTIQEYDKITLLSIFIANHRNLEAQIPCRHCGGRDMRPKTNSRNSSPI